MATETLDILVIGGGLTGAAVARDAALRGLRVGLVESEDFAAGSSSRSAKLLWAGPGWPGPGRLRPWREAESERRVLTRLAPHLLHPVSILQPIYGNAGEALLRPGLWLGDWLTGARGRRHRVLEAAATLAAEPLLASRELAAAVFADGFFIDDFRLVLATLKAAAATGALIANHARVVRLQVGRQETAALVHDLRTGVELRLAARVVIDTTGAPPGRWSTAMAGQGAPVRAAHGLYLVVAHGRLPLSHAICLRQPDASVVLAAPRPPYAYAGLITAAGGCPTDAALPDAPTAQRLLDALNTIFPGAALGPADITGAWAGLQPSLAATISVSPGLVTVSGGRLAVHRQTAQRAVYAAAGLLAEQGRPRVVRGDAGHLLPLAGGNVGPDSAAFAAQAAAQAVRAGLSAATATHLVQQYGSEYGVLLQLIAADAALAAPLHPDLPLIAAEVVYAVRHEMAVTLADFLDRRTGLLLFAPSAGQAIAPAAADLMGRELCWDAQRRRQECAAYRERAAAHTAFAAELNQAAPAPVATPCAPR